MGSSAISPALNLGGWLSCENVLRLARRKKASGERHVKQDTKANMFTLEKPIKYYCFPVSEGGSARVEGTGNMCDGVIVRVHG